MNAKTHLKISQADFVAIGRTQETGAVTTDTGFYVELNSPAYKAYINLKRK